MRREGRARGNATGAGREARPVAPRAAEALALDRAVVALIEAMARRHARDDHAAELAASIPQPGR